jgi:hypothetical protein
MTGRAAPAKSSSGARGSRAPRGRLESLETVVAKSKHEFGHEAQKAQVRFPVESIPDSHQQSGIWCPKPPLAAKPLWTPCTCGTLFTLNSSSIRQDRIVRDTTFFFSLFGYVIPSCSQTIVIRQK